MKLYTVVVHNLQMCMKEYRCCLKFRRGDNSTYTFTKRGVVYLWRPLDVSQQAHQRCFNVETTLTINVEKTLNFSWIWKLNGCWKMTLDQRHISTLNFSWIWKLNGCWKMTLDQRHISTLNQCWCNVNSTLNQINVDARFNQRWIFSIFYSNITSLVFSHSNIFHGREFITTLLTKRYEKGYMVYWQHYKKVW